MFRKMDPMGLVDRCHVTIQFVVPFGRACIWQEGILERCASIVFAKATN